MLRTTTVAMPIAFALLIAVCMASRPAGWPRPPPASTTAHCAHGAPVGVMPGQDDLAYYPLIYWAVTDTAPDPKMIGALNAYLAHGGMLLIDSHAGDTALGPDALRRATEGLEIPALGKLDDRHVLAHTFYLLHDFPGRWADALVTGGIALASIVAGSLLAGDPATLILAGLLAAI